VRNHREPSRIGAVLVLGAILGSFVVACGVAADDQAAVVLGSPVSTDTIDTLASDEAFLQAVGGGLPGTESVVSGDSARAALTFAIQRTAAQAELERWEPDLVGLSGDELRQAIGFDEAAEQLSSQVPPGLSDVALEELTAFVATTTRLGERLQAVASTAQESGAIAPEDLRRLFDGVPSLWDRTCVAVVAVAEQQSVEVATVVADGRPLEEIVAEVEGAELAFDPREECVPVAQLPDVLRVEVEGAAIGETIGPVFLESDRTGRIAVFFRVDGTEQLSFDDPATAAELDRLVQGFASAQQPAQAAGSWLNLILPGAVEVNPRYGRAAVGVAGGFEVVAPEGPIVLRPEVVGIPEELPIPVPTDVPPGPDPEPAPVPGP
jgi:hypothetical protein